MANLPAAVQAQIDEADRIVSLLNTDPQPPEQQSIDTQAEQAQLQSKPEEQIAQQQSLEEIPTLEQKDTKRQGKNTSDSEETWEQRYRSLNGMYNADMPRLQAQVKEMTSQVQILMSELEQERNKPVESKPVSNITDEDRETFGPDLVELIERAAEGKVATLRDREKTLIAQIEAFEKRLGMVTERQVESERDRFINGLNSLAPNWEALNVDQGFMSWLSEIDPIYGVSRQAALNTAYEASDANRVAQIFNIYSGMRAPVAQQRNNQELKRQIAPSTSRGSAAPIEQNNTKIFSSREIEQFYNDWRRGDITEDEAARIEREINAAAAEGRIR
jgi:hypothetical protein